MRHHRRSDGGVRTVRYLSGGRTSIATLAFAVIAILVPIVVLQNTDAVETKILFMTITVSRAVLLFGTTVVGYVMGICRAAQFGK